MTNFSPELISFMGALAGGISISIAIYLQVMANKKCNPRYVLIYALVGLALVMINMNTFNVSWGVAAVLEVIVYLSVLVGEIIMAFKIYDESEDADPDSKFSVEEIHQ